MEAAVREVPANRLEPPTERADYADWYSRSEAAEERWRAMNADADTWNPHLDRLGEAKAALEADVKGLRDLRGHDEAWAALHAMRGGIVERAKAENMAAFDLPEWDAFAGKARALAERAGLPETAARAAGRILEYDHRCREVESFLAGGEAHGARWDALRAAAGRGENVSIVDLPGYAPLTKDEDALRETGQAMRADAAGWGPPLARVPDGAARAAHAFERLESHSLLDRCVAAMDGLGEAARDAWAMLPDNLLRKALDDAEELAKERALEDEARRRLEAAIAEQAALAARLAAIGQLLRDMAELEERERELEENTGDEELPRSLVPGREDWRAANEAFVEAARPALEDAAFEEFRQTRPDLAAEIGEAVAGAQARLAVDAREQDLDTLLAEAGYREEAGSWHPDAADFPIACGHDVTVTDLVRFSADAGALPGGRAGDDELNVSVVAGVVARTAGRTEPEDLCTLETLWRSDGGPGGLFAARLDLLTVGGCARTEWRDEEARRGAAEEQGWELAEARQALFEQAAARERHQSLSM